MNKVIIISKNKKGETEWEYVIEKDTMRGARSAAARWIKKNVFKCDFVKVTKININSFTDRWSIV